MQYYHRKKGKAIAKETKAHVEWVKRNTTRVVMNLNNHTDADILHYLETVPSKQGAIKQALRELIERVTSADDQR